MRTIIIVVLAGLLFTSAGVKDCKRDTCSVPVKAKQDSTSKKPVKKRPLYQMIFMI